MITIRVNLDGVVVTPKTVDTSDEATAHLREVLALEAVLDYEPALWILVTGDTTAASCRHHPLSPGTIGDPRR